MLRRYLWVAAVAANVACHAQTSTTGTSSPTVEPASSPQTDQTEAAPEATPRRPGIGHSGHIDMVAVSPDGNAALSRDTHGSVRFWPRLDGTAEPVLVPSRGATSFSVAASETGWTMLSIDPSGGAELLELDQAGKSSKQAQLPPFEPVVEGHVLPGGQTAVVLFKDRTIRLISSRGKELARVDERRFRPDALRLSSDGSTVLAVMEPRSSSSGFTTEIQAFAIDATQFALERRGAPQLLKTKPRPTDQTLALSPDGKRVVVAGEPGGTQWSVIVADLTAADAQPKVVEVELPAHLTPVVGFASRTEVFAGGNDGKFTWVADIETDAMRARAAPPQNFNTKAQAYASAAGTTVAGYGTFLFVQEASRAQHRFLGYRAQQAESVAISPSGDWVAWGYLQSPVYVESTRPVDDHWTAAVKVPVDVSGGSARVRFFDDDHLLVFDSTGGIRLVQWANNRTVDQAGVAGTLRNIEFDSGSGMLLVDRHSNDVSVFEASVEHGFRGPYLIADGSYRVGLLAGAEDDAARVWTIDAENRERSYSLSELRSDLTQREIRAKGAALKAGEVSPLAIDRLGRHYGVRLNGSKREVFVRSGETMSTAAAPSDNVSQIIPSPDGTRFIAVSNHSGQATIAAYSTEPIQKLWTFSTGVFNKEIVWSPDGAMVGVAAQTGAVVLDSNDGVPVRLRCGLEFVSLGAPPTNAFNALPRRTMCEP